MKIVQIFSMVLSLTAESRVLSIDKVLNRNADQLIEGGR